jgi:hypothetical protein
MVAPDGCAKSLIRFRVRDPPRVRGEPDPEQRSLGCVRLA